METVGGGLESPHGAGIDAIRLSVSQACGMRERPLAGMKNGLTELR